MKQLVAAVTHMHAASVSHQDIKLDSILSEQNITWSIPRLRIIDFVCGILLRTASESFTGMSDPIMMCSATQPQNFTVSF